MEYSEKVMELMYRAIDEVNLMADAGKAIPRSPDGVLMGASSNVDSLTFVNLAAALEESIEQAYNEKMSLIDLIFSGKKREWTIADLAAAVTRNLNHKLVGQPLAGTGR